MTSGQALEVFLEYFCGCNVSARNGLERLDISILYELTLFVLVGPNLVNGKCLCMIIKLT